MTDKAPIYELYSDSGPFDKAVAAQALKPFVVIQNETHQIYLKGERKLPVETKILAYALAKKLLAMEGRIEEEYVSALEVHETTGMKKGSVDSAFKKLREEGILVGGGRRYEVPHYMVPIVVGRLQSTLKKSKRES